MWKERRYLHDQPDCPHCKGILILDRAGDAPGRATWYCPDSKAEYDDEMIFSPMRIKYYMLDQSIFEALESHRTGDITHEHGSFIMAVLSNDLVDACARADDTSQATFFDITRFVYCEMPPMAFGSRRAVNEWITGNRDRFLAKERRK